MRTCSDCGESKPDDQFHRNSNGRAQGYCKLCSNARNRAWRKANPDKVAQHKRTDLERHPGRRRTAAREYARTPGARATRAAWMATHADEQRSKQRAYRTGAGRWARIEKQYGITQAEYLSIVERQGGRCPVCLRLLDDVTVHIDHDHSCCPGGGSCGRCVRGLLCQRCNQSIGLLGDDAATAARASEYLTTPGKADPCCRRS